MKIIRIVVPVRCPSVNAMYRPAYNYRRRYSYLRLDTDVSNYKCFLEDYIKANYAEQLDYIHSSIDPRELHCIMGYFKGNIEIFEDFKKTDLSNLIKATEDSIFNCLEGFDDKQVCSQLNEKSTGCSDFFVYGLAFITHPDQYSIDTFKILSGGYSSLLF